MAKAGYRQKWQLAQLSSSHHPLANQGQKKDPGVPEPNPDPGARLQHSSKPPCRTATPAPVALGRGATHKPHSLAL